MKRFAPKEGARDRCACLHRPGAIWCGLTGGVWRIVQHDDLHENTRCSTKYKNFVSTNH